MASGSNGAQRARHGQPRASAPWRWRGARRALGLRGGAVRLLQEGKRDSGETPGAPVFAYEPWPYQLLAVASTGQWAVPLASMMPTASISFQPDKPGTPI